MKTVTYHIPSIHCMHCVHTINTEVGEIDGVKNVDTDEATQMTTIMYDLPATEDKIVAMLKEIDYAPEGK
jgi:copper chaperone CopZ